MLPNQFINSKYETLFFGSGCLEKSIQTVIANNNIKRVILVSTPSLVNSAIFVQLKNIIKANYVGEFTQTHMHAPITTIKLLAKNITQSTADLVISLGGGSVIDSVKAALINLDANNPLPHLAIPTTLSGAEFTWYFATTENGIKTVNNNAKAAPRWVVLDASATQNTPRELWTDSGMKTFADCIEVLSSPNTNFLAQNAAIEGLKLIHQYLVDSCDYSNTVARSYCQIAPAYALSALVNAGGGLVTALRHQLGAKFNISHGLASAIVLPHVLKWNSTAAKDTYTAIAKYLNLETAEQFLSYVDKLLIQFKLNKKLHEFISDKNILDSIADNVLKSPLLGNNPRPIKNKQDIISILTAAW